MHRFSCFALLATSLALSAGCPADDDAPPVTDPVADARDGDALAAWLARPNKSCTLAAVYPHHAGLVDGYAIAVQGLDAAVILDGADANGFRRFDDDGFELARFAELGDLLDIGDYDQRLVGDDRVLPPDAALSFDAGVCTLEIAGEVVFAEPLYEDVTVDVASWPGMDREPRWVDGGNVREPALEPGFEWLDPMPMLWSRVHPPVDQAGIAKQVATWLDPDDTALAARVNVTRGGDMLLELVDAPWFPPLVLGDGIYTLVQTEERERYQELDQPVWRWHVGGTGDTSSVIEIHDDAGGLSVRYAGTEDRTGAAAAERGVACANAILERALTGRSPARWGVFPELSPLVAPCRVLAADLTDALYADDDAMAIALWALSAEARDRYGLPGRAGDGSGYYYLVPDDDLVLELIARAMIDELPAIETVPPVAAYDDGRTSWTALTDSEIFVAHPELRQPLAEAVLVRAFYDHSLVANAEEHRAPPLTAEDVAALVEQTAAVKDPYTGSVLLRLVDSISWNR